MPEPFTEVGLERTLQALLTNLGAGALVGLDCGEYPCVGIVTFPGTPPSTTDPR